MSFTAHIVSETSGILMYPEKNERSLSHSYKLLIQGWGSKPLKGIKTALRELLVVV